MLFRDIVKHVKACPVIASNYVARQSPNAEMTLNRLPRQSLRSFLAMTA